jgi:hypothetical protein
MVLYASPQKINQALSRSLSRSTIVVLIVAAVLTAVVAILELGQIGSPEPLVSTEGWTAPGEIRPLQMAISNLLIPHEMQSHPKFSLWTTWTPSGAAKGVITSPPFRASQYLAVPFQIGGERGYPYSDRVTLRCNTSGAEIPVSTSQSFGGFGEWNVAYIEVPLAFCGSDVQVVASSNAAHSHSYVGIGTPFSVSRALYLAHSGFGAKALVVAGTWLLFGAIFLAGVFFAPRRTDRFGAGALAIGVAGMVVFLGGTVSAWGARAAAIGCVIVAFFVILRAVITDRASTTSIVRENSIPLMAWLALALCLIAFMTGADNTAGKWAANALFSPLSWSTDNELPVLFAQRLAHRTATTAMTLGGWYFDDRTPLLTAMIVIPQTFLADPLASLLGGDFVYLADSVAAITILAIWMAVLLWLASKLAVRHPSLFIAIVAISPFMFFNTVYTWGKLLGATYLLLAVGLTLESCKSDEGRSNLALIPAALTLSYLSHAGNAVAGLAFLIVFWSVLRWRDARVLAIGTIAALAIIAPWGYWTQFIQPGGNALLRFQLANDAGFDHRSVPVLSSMIEYLQSLGWRGWLMMKLRWIAWLFNLNGFFPLWVWIPVDDKTASFWANQRALDFAVVSRTIGVASLGVLAALWRRVVHGDSRDRLALRLIGCGALGIGIMILLIVQVGITHDHAYGAIIMIAIGGAMFLADRDPRLPSFLFLVWLVYFAYVWIWQPAANADQIHPKSLILAAVWATAVASMVAAWAAKRGTMGGQHLGDIYAAQAPVGSSIDVGELALKQGATYGSGAC